MTIKLLSIYCVIGVVSIIVANTVQSTEEEQEPLQTSSRQAYIDEATGELTSTPPAAETLSGDQTATVNQAKVKPIEYITHPDGTVEGKLNGHYQSELKVMLGCDGSLTQVHSNQAIETLDCIESE